MRREKESHAYWALLEQAVAALRQGDFDEANTAIAQGIAMDMNAPEPHNLLGALYELKGDYYNARKHYRVAYALDPNYAPCCRNLERISSVDFRSQINDIDLGVTGGAHASDGGTHYAVLGNAGR